MGKSSIFSYTSYTESTRGIHEDFSLEIPNNLKMEGVILLVILTGSQFMYSIWTPKQPVLSAFLK